MEQEKTAKLPIILSLMNLFFLALLIGFGFFYFGQQKETTPAPKPEVVSPKPIPSPANTAFELEPLRLEVAAQKEQIAHLTNTLNQANQKLVDIEEKSKKLLDMYYSIQLKDVVDFTVPRIQDLTQGFMIASAKQNIHLTGVKFTGRIINTQAVKHRNCTFEILVNGISRQFSISQISSGNSTAFSVYVPDLNLKDARYARIKYLSSTVAFYTR